MKTKFLYAYRRSIRVFFLSFSVDGSGGLGYAIGWFGIWESGNEIMLLRMIWAGDRVS